MNGKLILLITIVILFSFSSAYGIESKYRDSICKNYKSIYEEQFYRINNIFVGEFIKPLYDFGNVVSHMPTQYAQYKVKEILYSPHFERSHLFYDNLEVDSLITVAHNLTNLVPSKKKKQGYVFSKDIFYSDARLILFVWSRKGSANDLRYKVLKDNSENRKLVKSLAWCWENVWSPLKKTDE